MTTLARQARGSLSHVSGERVGSDKGVSARWSGPSAIAAGAPKDGFCEPDKRGGSSRRPRPSALLQRKRMKMTDSHNTAPTRFIEANGVPYAYRRFGAPAGTPLVFLQHFRGGLDNWDPKVTDGIAKDRPVILFNNAGVASSGGEPADTVSGMAKHVVTLIHALCLKQVDLLGFSLGGFVAQQVALENPDLIRRMVFAGTGPEGGEGMDAFTPKVVEHATPETPVIENFLYLFFSPSEA